MYQVPMLPLTGDICTSAILALYLFLEHKRLLCLRVFACAYGIPLFKSPSPVGSVLCSHTTLPLIMLIETPLHLLCPKLLHFSSLYWSQAEINFCIHALICLSISPPESKLLEGSSCLSSSWCVPVFRTLTLVGWPSCSVDVHWVSEQPSHPCLPPPRAVLFLTHLEHTGLASPFPTHSLRACFAVTSSCCLFWSCHSSEHFRTYLCLLRSVPYSSCLVFIPSWYPDVLNALTVPVLPVGWIGVSP